MRFVPVGVHVYLQELRGLARGRLVWFGLFGLWAFFALLMIGPGLQAHTLPDALFAIYLLVPSGFATFAALQFAGPRSNRFVQAVFTTPVRESSYFLAKLAVLFTVAGFYYLATAPFLVLHWLFVGFPAVYLSYMFAGVLLILFALAYGTLVGVIFVGRSLAAPVTLSLLPFLALLAYPMLWDIPAMDSDRTLWQSLIVRFLHLNPQIGVVEGFGLPSFFLSPEDPWRSLLFLGLSTLGLGVLAAWIFLRHQSVETWKDTSGARTAVLLVALIVLLMPVFAPAMSYAEPEGASQIQVSSGDTEGALFVEPGTVPDRESVRFSLAWNDPYRLQIGRSTPAELFLLFEAPRGDWAPVDVQVTAVGSAGLEVRGADGGRFDFSTTEPAGSWTSRSLVARIPVQVEVTRGEALQFSEYPVTVWTNMTVVNEGDDEGSSMDIAGDYSFTAVGEVPGAYLKAVAAGSVVPLVFLTMGIVRESRRR